MTSTETGRYTDVDKKEDVKLLHGMGYAQELDRRMGRFSNFAISFSIICIMSGGINSLAQATSGAGGAGVGLGWPLGCAISGVFALALAWSPCSAPSMSAPGVSSQVLSATCLASTSTPQLHSGWRTR
jgi:hypothetical protein